MRESGGRAMSWRDFLFSFRGRFNRAKYWQFVLVYVLAVVAVAAIAIALAPIGVVASGLFIALAALILIIPMLVATFAVGAKRLHDRNKSGWWMVVFFIVPGVLSMVAEGTTPTPDDLSAFGVVLTIVAFGISIWGFVELGILRGTRGSNKYGPDPLETPAATAAAFD
jgi:uncharacterized membrane protein YhaH (DUF805 family)